MQTLTCPIPSNINLLQNNGFLFTVNKLPDIKFFCQEVVLPSLRLPAAQMDTPLSVAPIPGEKLEFGELAVTFLIDEGMTNYIALHNWMVGLGFPQSHEQYRNFMSTRNDQINITELLAGYSDAVLQVLNSANNPIQTVYFIDVFPTSLDQLTLQSATQDTQYLAASASFAYTYYRFG